MNTTPSRKKGLLALMVLAVVCLSVLAGGTYAYFTAERTSYNVITMGTLNMELVEETSDGQPWPTEGVSGVMPTSVVDKVVYLKNAGTVPFYGRILVEALVTFENGQTVVANPALIVLDWNTEQWTLQDGCYYYNGVIGVGEQTEPLFTTVSFAPEMGNQYQNAVVNISVRAQAVQSQNNGATVLEAKGWPSAAVIE